jgi:hypothetical protein
MATMGWVLAAAVIAAISWILALVGGQLARGDRRRRRLAQAAPRNTRRRRDRRAGRRNRRGRASVTVPSTTARLDLIGELAPR